MATHNPPIPSRNADISAPPAAAPGLFAAIAAFWNQFLQAAFHPYHPEQHYMRGPGPACAAKRKTAK